MNVANESLAFVGRTLKSIHTVGVALVFKFQDGTYAFLRPSEYGHGILAMFVNEVLSPKVAGRMTEFPLPEVARAGLGRVILHCREKGNGNGDLFR